VTPNRTLKRSQIRQQQSFGKIALADRVLFLDELSEFAGPCSERIYFRARGTFIGLRGGELVCCREAISAAVGSKTVRVCPPTHMPVC